MEIPNDLFIILDLHEKVVLIIFYQLFLFLYRTGIRIASLFNSKARLWIRGRQQVFEQLKAVRTSSAQKVIWMHAASLGEYEQGKPVLRLLQTKYPGAKIVVTFFSPSGYEIIQPKQEFEHVLYLPMDSYFHARKWLKILKPNLVLWVKYEYWYYYLREINKRKIPLLLVSGVFRENQVFFRWYGGLYRRMLHYFSHFFLQNEESALLLKRLVAQDRITVSGDTRCDRVILTAERFQPIPEIEKFCAERNTVVMGSTWPADEQVWAHYIANHPEKRFIIAPHEIDEENIARLQQLIPGSVLFTNLSENSGTKNCVIINNIGMLSRLYHYGHITYVGGGFGDNGLHNILEPAVFGKPVLFGPVFYKSFEARDLIDATGAISINTALELEEAADALFNNPADRIARGSAARDYIYRNAGASEKIVKHIQNTAAQF